MFRNCTSYHISASRLFQHVSVNGFLAQVSFLTGRILVSTTYSVFLKQKQFCPRQARHPDSHPNPIKMNLSVEFCYPFVHEDLVCTVELLAHSEWDDPALSPLVGTLLAVTSTSYPEHRSFRREPTCFSRSVVRNALFIRGTRSVTVNHLTSVFRESEIATGAPRQSWRRDHEHAGVRWGSKSVNITDGFRIRGPNLFVARCSLHLPWPTLQGR